MRRDLLAALASGRRRFSPLDLAPALLLDPSYPASVALNGSALAGLSDQSSFARHVAQGTALNQPAFSASGGPGGRPYFTIGGTPYLAGTGAASTWSWLHTAAWTLWIVMRPVLANPNGLTALFGTSVSGAVTPGSVVTHDDRAATPANDRVGFASYGSGVLKLGPAYSGDNAAPAQAWTCAQWIYDPSSAAPITIKTAGVARYSTATGAITPDPASSTAVAQIGRTGVLTTGALIDVALMYAIPRAATAHDEAQVRSWIARTCGGLAA